MNTEDHNKPLSENVKLLGEMLGDILKKHVSEKLYKKVEQIRSLSKSLHENEYDEVKQAQLIKLLHQLSAKDMHGVIRSYAHFLNLTNIAESHHRIRRTRWHQIQNPDSPQKGSLAFIFNKLKQEGFSAKQIRNAALSIKLELVLTAHPTEVHRRTLIQKFDRVRAHLAQLDRGDLTPKEIEASHQALSQEITSIWLSDEIRRKKPTPMDEAKWGLAVIESSLWHAIPKFLRELDTLLRRDANSPLPKQACPIRFGTWMGGDRDGNPNVTHQVSHNVCMLARWYAADLYEKAVYQLSAELSMSACNTKLKKITHACAEPYRALLKPLHKALQDTREWAQDQMDGKASSYQAIEHVSQLLDPLLACYQSLMDVGAQTIAQGSLLDLIRRVYCFGLSLVRLDFRQESSRHTALVDAILTQNNQYTVMDDEQSRINFLVDVYQGKQSLHIQPDLFEEEALEVWQTFKLINNHPQDTFGAYIISMASSPIDVIHVWVLQKLAGVEHFMPVVPLFETLEDLQNAGSSLDSLLKIKAYKHSINKHQEIMIGYSDSAKDAGILAAGWGLYQAQEALVSIAKKHKVALTLFHGRGGTVGRGGAPAHMAILSQPPGAVHGSLRVTEQGEVIRNKFGFEQTALRTLELYASAIMDAYCNRVPQPKQAWRDLMDRLSLQSKKTYQHQVYEDKDFIHYFQAVTPVNEIGQLFIGSRPTKRGRKSGIDDLRAIPWIFAWMQNRLMVPSWLGVGEALASLSHEEFALAQNMVQQWPFFGSLMSLIEMVLAKADPMIAMHYDNRLVTSGMHPIGEKLRSQFEQTTHMIKDCLQIEALLSTSPTLARSLKVRQPYVYPINILQAECLSRARAHASKLDGFEQDALLISIGGIAAGMRNTG